MQWGQSGTQLHAQFVSNWTQTDICEALVPKLKEKTKEGGRKRVKGGEEKSRGGKQKMIA